jgi:hypothetical protein
MPRPPASFRRAFPPPITSLLIVAVLAACGAPGSSEPAAEFSFTKDRQRWRATTVSAQIKKLAADEVAALGDEGEEWTVQITARRDPEGEQVTFFAIVPTVEGTHVLRTFGALLGFAARPTVPTPMTNVCGSGSLSDSAGETAGGTLTVEVYDQVARTLSGNFRVNVCDVQEPSDAKTLSEGIFLDVPYGDPYDDGE